VKRLPALCLLLGLLAGACSSDSQLFYTAETGANFLTSCADYEAPDPLPLDAGEVARADRREAENLRSLQNRICQCAIDKFELKIPYETFAEFDAELKADLEKPLQKASVAVLASCIEQEGSL
jgi:hypothetical protein